MGVLLNKLPKLTEKQKNYFDIISKYSFYLGLFVELTIVILEKSEYIIQYEGLWFRFTFLLFGISLMTTKHHLKEWSALFFFGLIGAISYKVTGRNEILRWIVFIWACQGKEMKKVLKFTFWYTLIGCIVIFLLSVMGIYGAVFQEAVYRTQYAWTPGVLERRFTFGMGHPNAFHCMMLVVTWLGIYCYFNKIKWYGYLFISLGHIIIFSFTDSKTGMLMSVITIMVVVIALRMKKNRYFYMGIIAVVIGAVGLSVFMAGYSQQVINNGIWHKIDTILSNRILNLYYDTRTHEGTLASWSLWSSAEKNVYFDLGIVRMFYWYGVIPSVTYFLCQCRLLWCGYKKNDNRMAIIIGCITIYSIFEAHFVSDYMGRNYILFFFGMYLKDLLGIEEEKRGIVQR